MKDLLNNSYSVLPERQFYVILWRLDFCCETFNCVAMYCLIEMKWIWFYFFIYQNIDLISVLPMTAEPTSLPTQEDELLPQWAIAVIVIGLASLLFVIIFGVSVVRTFLISICCNYELYYSSYHFVFTECYNLLNSTESFTLYVCLIFF
jgi:hypothetical protein